MLRSCAFALLLSLSIAAQAQELRLPFEGRWFVAQGGDTINVNHHMAVQAQWYGIDFVKTGGEGGRELASVAQPSKLEHFHGWNAPVLAPVPGRIVAVVDGLPDNPLGQKDPRNPAGNHVVIATAQGTYVFLGHLRKGTVAVKKGDEVKPGQPLGRVGNSGNSDFPHLHLHVQDGPVLNEGRGLNPVFADMDVELTGKKFEGVAWPLIRGLFVQAR